MRGLGTAFATVVNKKMSFDLVRKIVATHIATLDRLEKRTAFMKSVGLAEMDPIKSSFCGKSKLKYHAGAVAAWKDAGYKVAACAQ